MKKTTQRIIPIASILAAALLISFLLREVPRFIVVLVLLLSAALFLFLGKVYFKRNEGTPDSPIYAALFWVVSLLCRRRSNVKLDDSLLQGHSEPFLFLCNHESFWDFYYVHRLIRDRKPVYVLNRFYFLNPILGWIGRRTGMIPKRLFTADFETPVRIMRTLRKGYPVVVFPEGRLSVDGRQNPIVENSASFCRRLGVDVVLGSIRGAYFGGPKWRSRSYPTEVRVKAVLILTPTEMKAMSDDQLQALIAEALAFDESMEPQVPFPQKDKAVGLENLLYRCADCGELYTTASVGNDLICRACGRVHTLNDRYRFTDEIGTIGTYYDRIKAMERAELGDLYIEAPVKTTMFQEKRPRKVRSQGVCTLTREAFSFRSEDEALSVPLGHLPALPFSCSEEFETYFHENLYYFYPMENPRQTTRWALLVDLLNEQKA